jgi:eukaryotic-like serine/threonine-protein kinase
MPQFDEKQTSLITEFLNEVKQCCKLIHPSIVKVFQYGENPTPWMSMEYMPKGTLTRRIGRLSIPESLHIGIKLIDALAYARTLHLAHRYITPDNVLFDAKDVPKLTNWRIASITQKLYKNTSLSETVNAYYPPEKLRSGLGGSDWLSDIYQIGVLLYEMLTGKPPFQEKGEALIKKKETELPPRPSEANPNIHKELDFLLLCCLAKNKKDRYQNPAELKSVLEKLAGMYQMKIVI